jgi:hypothetical protein
MEFYQLKTAYFWLVDAGFEDIEVRIFSVRSNGYPHSFFFGRKVRPAAPDHEPGAETAS